MIDWDLECENPESDGLSLHGANCRGVEKMHSLQAITNGWICVSLA